MDNHPIPQDVTGFQFRLIGNMTVKQFAYVAVGAVGAVVIYYIPIPGIVFTVFKIVLIPLFILAGVGLAFLPIEGRPIDIMVSHFFKALFSPNMFIYKKVGGQLPLSAIHIDQRAVNAAAHAQAAGASIPTHTQEQRHIERRKQLNEYLNTIHQNQAADDKEASRISNLFGTQSAALATRAPSVLPTPVAPSLEPVPVQTAAPLITPEPASTLPTTQQVETPAVAAPATPTDTAPVDEATLIQVDTQKIAEEETLIQQMSAELTQAKTEEQTAQGPVSETAHAKVAEVETRLQELMAAKKQLEEELQQLTQKQTPKIITTPQIPTSPAVTKASPPPAPMNPVPTSATSGFPSLPDTANMLLGVVRDSSGNVLPHILVEVKDTEDNPVRAFKTNQLGQFLSATPLKDGVYTVTFEDTKNAYQFDPVTVNVNNTILQPIEIAAHDLREELRKSLFV